MEKMHFLVGFPEYFGKNDWQKVWPIFGTLEAVVNEVEIANHHRALKGRRPIKARAMTQAEIDTTDRFNKLECKEIVHRFCILSDAMPSVDD